MKESIIKTALSQLLMEFDGSGPYLTIDNGEEVFIEDEIENFFIGKDITEFDYDVELMFSNCGIDIYSCSCVWLENGKLESLLNVAIERE